MMFSAARYVIAVIAVMMLACPAIASNQVLSGSFDAVGNGSLPPGTVIAVSAESFTDLNTRLQPIIETVLAADGYRVDPNARLELTFNGGSTDATTAALEAQPKDTLLDHVEVDNVRRRDDSLDPTDSDFRSMELESVQGSVSVDLEDPRDDKPGRARHTLLFFLGERGQPPLWQGTLRVPARPQDPFIILKRMVPVLAERIGYTANNQLIEIP